MVGVLFGLVYLQVEIEIELNKLGVRYVVFDDLEFIVVIVSVLVIG